MKVSAMTATKTTTTVRDNNQFMWLAAAKLKCMASVLVIVFALLVEVHGQGTSPARDAKKTADTSATTSVATANNTATTFTNPLLPAGADPWSIYRDGF